ncbi:hypothetical protein [Kitasatospora cheerisanensis]|uniref:Uncharacterized protein n=1 Tax=Kitasatospora cheerisanensis KCTC 2395 TaxID=1348663 RepID=A0A066YKY8_9ACTN|nr:hypothetical protein KCH_76430 [Kitasatospora cheerisanensis KCTC 2395]
MDIGVHTIILDTVAYTELCRGHHGGQLLHHMPAAEYKQDGPVLRTAQLIAAEGWDVDRPLWADAAKCSPCHPGNDSH